MQNVQRIVLVDFGAQYTQLIARLRCARPTSSARSSPI